jgi:integrase
MARRRTKHFHLPPLMTFKQGRYYYGRNQIALGDDFSTALRRYAELHAVAELETPTFAVVAGRYLLRGTGHLAAKTLREYQRQMPRLVKWIGGRPLESVTPMMIRRWLTERGNTVAGTREKALLSAVFTWAREAGLYDGANPCSKIKGKGSKRTLYVGDDVLSAVIEKADATTAAFLELCYLTGQRPSDVLKMTRADVRDGHLWVAQGKTGAKVRIAVVGTLKDLVDRLLEKREGVVESLYLVRDADGQRPSLQTLRKRFWKARSAAGVTFQIRDLRAKTASDADTAKHATALLGHMAASTTDRYIRRVAGQVVEPVRSNLTKAKR